MAQQEMSLGSGGLVSSGDDEAVEATLYVRGPDVRTLGFISEGLILTMQRIRLI